MYKDPCTENVITQFAFNYIRLGEMLLDRAPHDSLITQPFAQVPSIVPCSYAPQLVKWLKPSVALNSSQSTGGVALLWVSRFQGLAGVGHD